MTVAETSSDKLSFMQALGTTLLFALLGPLVGYIAVTAAMSPASLPSLTSLFVLSPGVVTIWIVIYLVGGLPAAVTGWFYSTRTIKFRNPIVSAVAGAVISMVFGLFFIMAWPWIVFAGCIAGFVCGLITMDWRKVLDYFSDL